MTPDEAAWGREHVWTPAMRREYATTPGARLACPCQYGPTGHCLAGQHHLCHRATPLPAPIGYITDRADTVLHLPAPYEHPHITATGHHRTSAAMVWYADRTCRWVCPCTCHTDGIPAARRPEPAKRPTPTPGGEPAGLFDLEVTR